MQHFIDAVLGNAEKNWYDWDLQGKRILDLGCGPNKVAGSIGVDCVAIPGVDLVYDLSVYPYPIADNAFDIIYLRNVIEHLDSVCKTMYEVYRLLKPGGLAYIITPHYTDPASWRDPQHKWHLNSYSFTYFDGSSHYSQAKFTILQNYLQLSRIWVFLGIELLINIQEKFGALRFFRRIWELYLCYFFRAKKMYFILRAER